MVLFQNVINFERFRRLEWKYGRKTIKNLQINLIVACWANFRIHILKGFWIHNGSKNSPIWLIITLYPLKLSHIILSRTGRCLLGRQTLVDESPLVALSLPRLSLSTEFFVVPHWLQISFWIPCQSTLFFRFVVSDILVLLLVNLRLCSIEVLLKCTCWLYFSMPSLPSSSALRGYSYRYKLRGYWWVLNFWPIYSHAMSYDTLFALEPMLKLPWPSHQEYLLKNP